MKKTHLAGGSAALVLMAALAACGGGPGGEIGDAIGNGLSCGLRNCTESSTLRPDEISLRFSAEQSEGQSTVVVSGFLGKSANVFTTVRMGSNERLDAAADGSADVRMSNPDGQRMDYTASFAAHSAQPRAKVAFVRDGVSHVGEVVLPPAFTVLQPGGTPTLARSAGNLLVTLSPASASSGAAAHATGRCTRTDDTTFDVSDESLYPRTDGTVAGGYRVDTLAVDQQLNAVSQRLNNSNPNTPLVSRCSLTVKWSTMVMGSVPATLNAHSAFAGYRHASHNLVYDAKL